MSAIGPGDWVEYVAAIPANTWLTTGAIYCVSEARAFDWPCGHCRQVGARCDRAGLRLAGIDPAFAGYTAFHCSTHFRPIYREKAGLIEGLLKPIEAPAEPEKVSA